MKIERVEAWPVTMRLGKPYMAAYDTLETTTNIFLRLVTDRRFIGYGCAAPDDQVTGETPEETLAAMRKVVEPALRGADPLRPALLLDLLGPRLQEQPSALAAVDMALLDILGKKCDLPVWKLLGGYRPSIKTSVTIGILSDAETVRQAREWVRRGFQALKLKGGLDAESDAQRVLKVREAVGEEIELRFDANQGYSVEQALAFIGQTLPARLELLEQPTVQGQFDQLAEVTREGGLPTMADESLATLRDAFRLASDRVTDMLNVKLMKVGGVAEGMQITAVARAAKMKVMVGCVDESALGIAAALHFALASPNVAYADLDGHIDLDGDPADGAVNLQNGILYPQEQAGLGFDLPG
jgi:L-alanine-DL-glutamate epimerase-like enolase superfamily enzyme